MKNIGKWLCGMGLVMAAMVGFASSASAEECKVGWRNQNGTFKWHTAVVNEYDEVKNKIYMTYWYKEGGRKIEGDLTLKFVGKENYEGNPVVVGYGKWKEGANWGRVRLYFHNRHKGKGWYSNGDTDEPHYEMGLKCE
jgi:hypothetical protein